MNTKRLFLLCTGLALLLFSTLACSFTSLIPGLGGGGAGTVSDLWPDVPKMDGMTLVKEDLPLEFRLMIQGIFATASDNQGELNFISYTTSKSAADVVKFYNEDRMKSAGWGTSDQLGCMATNDTTDTTGTSGGLCLYTKETGSNSGAMLAIIPADDTAVKKTTIFFARIELKNLHTPTPKK